MLSGVVHETGGGVYRIGLESGEVVEASIRGRLKLQERSGEKVVVGDRVRVAQAEDGAFTVEEVLPRSRELVRRAGVAGRKAKVLAANVDRMVIVVAGAKPAPRSALVDRLLVMGESNDLQCLIVINKIDLPGAREQAEALRNLYAGAGYDTLETSGVTGEGAEALEAVVCSGISVLVGPSGAGKSTLLNTLEPGLGLRTGELSRKRGTGRHTTVRSRLIPLRCGGLVADTPGFADAGIWKVRPDELADCFPEFRLLVPHCRFRGCSHLHEPDCKVRQAVDQGEIAASRFESYAAMLEESKLDERR